MSERKIFNYESKILDKETFDKFGYYPDSLGKSSSKFVVAVCRFCGQIMDIRKGFFYKSGSACHRNCKLKEMSVSGSPFLSDSTKQKAKETNVKRWGHECPQKSEAIRKKISDSKKDKEFQIRFKKTMQERHGVDNPAQMPDYAQKVKNTSLAKYKKDHFNLDPAIKSKRESTNIEKYGCLFPTQNESVKKKIKESWNNLVNQDDEKYFMFNFVSTSTDLWIDLKDGMSLSEISEKFKVDRIALNKVLLSKDFKDRYQSVYSYPKHQKQQELYKYLRSIGIDDLVMNENSIISLELDLYSPSKKIAIEFNGSYWHSEALLSPDVARLKHINKTKMCDRIGIRLIHIFEKQWEEKADQYKSFLRSSMGLNGVKLDARSCSINFDPQHEFMEKFHIQGKPRGVELWINLVWNDEVVGSMSISSHHRQNSSSKEAVLSRMVFKEGVTVRGGASRMLSYATKWAKINGFDKIISWSDNMISNGNVYKQMGFSLDKNYGPDYFYWDVRNNKYRSKQSQKKSANGCPVGMTERDWCRENSMYRIWDCGKKRWSLNL